jgi:hypothetical protein
MAVSNIQFYKKQVIVPVQQMWALAVLKQIYFKGYHKGKGGEQALFCK